MGPQCQDLQAEVGDFVVRRADRLWAYQLAVVVDDARQGVTDVVRGEDLADNTARQIHLQHLLGLPTPSYLHTPLVLAADGQKLSKQTGAQAVALDDPHPLAALQRAAQALGLEVGGFADDAHSSAHGQAHHPAQGQAHHQAQWLQAAVAAWAQRWCQAR